MLFQRALGRVSLVLFIAMHLACLFVIVYPPTWKLILLAIASYVVRMWAITVGFHRYLAALLVPHQSRVPVRARPARHYRDAEWADLVGELALPTSQIRRHDR